MAAKTLLLCCLIFPGTFATSGSFWHITDLHWDPNYKVENGKNVICESSNGNPAYKGGPFGSHACDSPWKLIQSCVHAMKEILPDPDFIVWTGDDTPHVENAKLSEEKVLQMIGNITDLIQDIFPSTKVYSALGNHDYHPKNQLPGHENQIYNKTAKMWEKWLEPNSVETFNKGGYYTEKLTNKTGFRMMVLNTNLYYKQNNATEKDTDPANQFAWADDVLTKAAQNKEKVYVIGHVPPGMFEKRRGYSWFRPDFNKRYQEMIDKHHAVILGQFFGHHHTDTFRMFYNSKEVPISTMFLSPGVTPWETTLPDVINGANNPGIRIFEYDTESFLVQDVVTYYLNLSRANMGKSKWEKEYRLTESFQVADASPTSMHAVLEGISRDNNLLQMYYRYNSVNFDLRECGPPCRASHVCSAREVDYQRYEHCVAKEAAPGALEGAPFGVLAMAVSLSFVLV
ncbi:acid sphingomyelinase-like phosphodiesterase 3b [Stigmatopora nigra]